MVGGLWRFHVLAVMSQIDSTVDTSAQPISDSEGSAFLTGEPPMPNVLVVVQAVRIP